ncbi:MAG TPA: PIG-L family deacetylase [Candidatus Binatia bacterium]|nr:PIG-L family deacetylase [Candidatus Binatia bacterium]
MAPLLAYPETLAAPPRGRVLVLAPHADDETIGCGGAIALHVAQGDPVAIAIATDGMRGDPDRFTGVDYRDLRRSEARAAAAILGAEPPEFWDLPDGGLVDLATDPSWPLVERVRDAIARLRPAIVYAPPETDVHPDHHALGAAVREALAAAGARDRPRALAYDVWVPVRATHVLDVSAVWERKETALRAYASQLAYNDYVRAARGLAAARTVYLPGSSAVEAFAAV